MPLLSSTTCNRLKNITQIATCMDTIEDNGKLISHHNTYCFEGEMGTTIVCLPRCNWVSTPLQRRMLYDAASHNISLHMKKLPPVVKHATMSHKPFKVPCMIFSFQSCMILHIWQSPSTFQTAPLKHVNVNANQYTSFTNRLGYKIIIRATPYYSE